MVSHATTTGFLVPRQQGQLGRGGPCSCAGPSPHTGQLVLTALGDARTRLPSDSDTLLPPATLPPVPSSPLLPSQGRAPVVGMCPRAQWPGHRGLATSICAASYGSSRTSRAVVGPHLTMAPGPGSRTGSECPRQGHPQGHPLASICLLTQVLLITADLLVVRETPRRPQEAENRLYSKNICKYCSKEKGQQ